MAKAAKTVPPVKPQPPPAPVAEHVDFPRPCTEFQYAVKLVQGAPPALTNNSFIAPGRYFTAINVHNPSTCKTVKVRWKVAVADHQGRHVSIITRFSEFILRPDEAFEIDARDIARWTGLPITDFVKGFVVLECPCELDVVAVYTALQGGPTASSSSQAFHTERVPARKIDACSDLKLDVSTGVANWMLTSSPISSIITPCPATVLPASANLTNPAWATQPGSLWITAHGNVNYPPAFPPGWYVFQYCFTLCSGFDKPALDLTAMADDAAWVRLNGAWVLSSWPNNPPIPWSLAGPPVTVPTITTNFLPGRNCLELVVLNGTNSHPTNPVGINVHGTLTAERGGCSEACGCCG
jgi:hypothetical protein